MRIVCFLYHHFGIYKGIPKAAGSWVERKRKRGREEGRVFFGSSFHIRETSHLKLRILSKLSDRRSGLHCSYFHGQADFTEWAG